MTAAIQGDTPQFAIGVDIEEVGRFRRLDRSLHWSFFRKVFTLSELTYCFSKEDPAPHLAVRFCAKEAIVKALAGSGIHRVPYCSIEILNTVKGVPKVRVNSKYKLTKTAVSLSHTTDYAIAFAIVFYVG